MIRNLAPKVLFILWALNLSGFLCAEDKSPTREGLVKLPDFRSNGVEKASEQQARAHVQSNMGTFEFTIPLPELATRGNMQYELSLRYNQQNGQETSGFGVGWELNHPFIQYDLSRGKTVRDRFPYPFLLVNGGDYRYISTTNGVHHYLPYVSSEAIKLDLYDEQHRVEF
ncbi:MAG: hypothetical protein HYW48_07850 [Deltaproteobacteria bacterium]|nr:hypothetical protein [Deltaproteobacteria bacterium]